MSSDQDIQDLLEGLQPGEGPPEEARHRVRGATYRAWRQIPQAAPARHRATPYVVTVSLAAAAVMILVAGPNFLVNEPGQPVVAQILHASGSYTTRGGGNPGIGLPAGTTIRTSASGRLLIGIGDNASLRLDADSHATFQGRDEVMLGDGRLFVDSNAFLTQGMESPSRAKSNVEIVTPQGVRVSSVGTQFGVSVKERRTSIAVREGTVRMAMGSESTTASASGGVGEVVDIERLAEVSRLPLATTDASWAWIHRAQPDFDLESASVMEFLHWAAREIGLALVFESDAVRQHAATIPLHGPPISAADLTRTDIVGIVETAPSFRISATDDHRLVVGFTRE